MLVKSVKKPGMPGFFRGLPGLPDLLRCALRVVLLALYRAGVAVDFALQFSPFRFA